LHRKSIGSLLDESRGLGKGFDFLRVALAFGVVTWHTNPIATGVDWKLVNHNRFFWQFAYSILIMFFALSGFLISGSALRLDLKNFLINRSLRIVPALAVEIILSACVIGPIFTILTLHGYFSSLQTYHYLTNIVGWINFELPGVFVRSPNSVVNESLWTVPYEIGCYVIMACCIQYGLLRFPWTVCVLAVSLLGAGMALYLSGFHEPPYIHVQNGFFRHSMDIAYKGFFGPGSKLYVAFTVGILFYLFRYKIPYSWPIFWACAIWLLAVAAIGTRNYPDPPVVFLTVLPLVYMMVFIGMSNLPAMPLFRHGDYSYGIYLYGWPIMQVMRALFPKIGANPVLLWIISVPAIVLFAMFSWHAIEKPILRLRKKFSFVARQRLAEAAPDPRLAGAESDNPIIGEQGQLAAATSKG
jgi:peptidoglycan/LPS O-acetylase OafA/YrhL